MQIEGKPTRCPSCAPHGFSHSFIRAQFFQTREALDLSIKLEVRCSKRRIPTSKWNDPFWSSTQVANNGAYYEILPDQGICGRQYATSGATSYQFPFV